MRSLWNELTPDLSQLLTRLGYLLQETGRGLQRGGWMNWAAISTVAVLLFLFGISLQASWQVEGLMHHLGSQLEISVYLKPEVVGANIEPLVVQFPEVASVKVLSKEQVWQELLLELGATDIPGAATGLSENPLVDELQVQVQTPADMPKLAQHLAQIPEVDAVQYLDEALQNLSQLSQGLNQIGLTVVSLLTLTAIAVITTTIRLIVLARAREIEIMQLVGATTRWIYIPFLLQGWGFGLAGAAIAWGLLATSQRFFGQLLAQQSNFLQFLATGLQLQPLQLLLLPLVLLGFGSLIGLLGSILAVRQFIFR